jgi:hypothetical protein
MLKSLVEQRSGYRQDYVAQALAAALTLGRIPAPTVPKRCGVFAPVDLECPILRFCFWAQGRVSGARTFCDIGGQAGRRF